MGQTGRPSWPILYWAFFAHLREPPSEVKAIIEKLTAAYNAATKADRARSIKLIERAKTSKREFHRREVHARNGGDPLRRAQPSKSRMVAYQDGRISPSRLPRASGNSPTKALAFWNPAISEMPNIVSLVVQSPAKRSR